MLDFRSFSSRFVLSVNGNDFKMLLVRFVLDREVPKEIFRLIPYPKPISSDLFSNCVQKHKDQEILLRPCRGNEVLLACCDQRIED